MSPAKPLAAISARAMPPNALGDKSSKLTALSMYRARQGFRNSLQMQPDVSDTSACDKDYATNKPKPVLDQFSQ